MSPDALSGLPCAIPFRARTARFDRPAASLAELLKGEGAEFIHMAVWTLRGRRADRAEHAELLALLEADPHGGKDAVIAALAADAPAAETGRSLPGLANYLQLRKRRGTPVVGPLLAGIIALYLRYPRLGWPARFVRSVPGKVRYTYRHSRKFLYRLAGRMQVPNPVEVRLALGGERSDPPENLEPAVAAYYQRLVGAFDRRGKRA